MKNNEESKVIANTSDPCDRGEGHLLFIMEQVPPSKISSMEIGWVIGRYILLVDAFKNEGFSDDFLEKEEGMNLLATYIITLENMLAQQDIDFRTFRGITDKGQEAILSRNIVVK